MANCKERGVNGMNTLAEVEQSEKVMLTPSDIAPLIGSDQQLIRMQARERPELLGFPVICIGSRVKIPREGFLRFMRGQA